VAAAGGRDGGRRDQDETEREESAHGKNLRAAVRRQHDRIFTLDRAERDNLEAMRTRLVFAGLVALGALGAAAACSIDESGTQTDGSADVTPIEGGADAPSDSPNDVVQGC